MPDCDMAATVTEVLAGSLSYNGQRCTALKLLFVHESIADAFLAAYCAKVDELKIGLPWESGVKLTPLPEPNKPAYLRELIADAKSLGAKARLPEITRDYPRLPKICRRIVAGSKGGKQARRAGGGPVVSSHFLL